METIIKAFSSVFFILVICVLGYGLIFSSIIAGRAEDFASSASVRIGNSNYDKSVISELKEDAKKSGYKMEVNLKMVPNTKRVDYGTLKLIYPYELPILKIKEKHCIESDIL